MKKRHARIMVDKIITGRLETQKDEAKGFIYASKMFRPQIEAADKENEEIKKENDKNKENIAKGGPKIPKKQEIKICALCGKLGHKFSQAKNCKFSDELDSPFYRPDNLERAVGKCPRGKCTAATG
jgi:hypothetical protein